MHEPCMPAISDRAGMGVDICMDQMCYYAAAHGGKRVLQLGYDGNLVQPTRYASEVKVRVTGSRPINAFVEHSKIEGIKQRAGRCHKENATAHGPEPPHTTNPIPPTAP
eukprot:357832-Chlamydomonas_euryale.AAC.3